MNSVLSVHGVTKRYPGVTALRDVSLEIQRGTCHALMGENGAGKSTLGKVLAGLIRPDEGRILFEGQAVHFRGPQDALRAGIAIVHQELLFCENLSVAENLALGDLPHRGPFVDQAAMRQQAEQWLAAVQADVDPDTTVGELSISKQQLVQIAGGIGRGAKVLIFDEPTSSLSRSDSDRLLGLINSLVQSGVTCVIVSHRLEEVFAVAQAITVLRDGAVVGTVATQEVDRKQLVQMMVGRPVDEMESPITPELGDETLRVEGFSRPGRFQDISFSLRAGEILGIAGLVGAGRTEVLEAIFGISPAQSGKLWVHGQPVSHLNPVSAMAHGIGLVPEDRKHHGLILGLTARENIALPTLDARARFGWIQKDRESSVVGEYFRRMRVKASSPEAETQGLSGGNQQKLVIAKWLAAQSSILLVDEPTRGVDVGAKAEIHDLIRELAAAGKSVLLVSSDLPELLAMSTRILVMREGRLVGELPAGANDREAMSLMAGLVGTPE